MAIVAIGAIVEPFRWYGCLKKRLDIRNAAPEADFALEIILRDKN